jgi:hypothetical protein
MKVGKSMQTLKVTKHSNTKHSNTKHRIENLTNRVSFLKNIRLPGLPATQMRRHFATASK